jgi:hypothetical protein
MQAVNPISGGNVFQAVPPRAEPTHLAHWLAAGSLVTALLYEKSPEIAYRSLL